MELEQRTRTIAVVIDRWDPERGGAERALADLARGLARRGWRVRVFACAGQASDDVELALLPAPRGLTRGARETKLGERLVRAAEASGAALTLGVRHLARVDVLWLHGGAHAVTLGALRSARAGRAVAGAEPLPLSRHRAFLALERAALVPARPGDGARRVVCVSGLVRRELEELYPAARARLVTVPNAVDLERFHPRERERSGAELRRALGSAPGTPLVGCAARNPLLKGVPVLLEALARLADRPWTCVIAGPRDRGPWERRARELGLGPRADGAPGRVRIVEHADAQAFAAACDLAVLPTWRDTCGLFVLEALASGTPAITTARAGAAECLADPETGSVLARPGDEALLATELERWLDRLARGPQAAGGALDRERVRRSVLLRGTDAALDAWEALLADVEAEKRGAPARA